MEELKDISKQHTLSILCIDIPGVYDKHLGHILNVLHDVEELHAHHRELTEHVLPAIHHTRERPYHTNQQPPKQNHASGDILNKP